MLPFKGVLQWNDDLINASGDFCDYEIGHTETCLDQI